MRFPPQASKASKLRASVEFDTLAPQDGSAIAPAHAAPRVRTVSRGIHWGNRELMERLVAFEILECGGNGNCFFLCVSELLRRKERFISAAQIRSMVADYIRDTSTEQHEMLAALSLQLELVSEEGSPDVRTLSTYAEHIRRDGTQASAKFELAFTAAVLNLRVRLVYQNQGDARGVLGADMRDCWIEPPSGSHSDVPLELHLLLLTQVRRAHALAALTGRTPPAASRCLRSCVAVLSHAFRSATGKRWFPSAVRV